MEKTLDPYVGDSLRVACASVACILAVEYLRLEYGYLAVMTTHMVMNQVTTTTFQRGFERLLGRSVGIAYGLLLVTLFRGAKVIGLMLELLGMLAIFYIHFSGRLAYTFLNCGLYLAAIIEIGRHEPDRVALVGWHMALALGIGVFFADWVNWFTGAEQSFEIRSGGKPLWPINGAWINHAVMLIVMVLVTLFVTRLRGLPVEQSVISVLMISIVTDRQSLILKGELRILGAFLAAVWALVSNLILSRLPHFPIYVTLFFFGMFVANYLARSRPHIAYAGVQMGLVLPMILVVPPSEFGTLLPAELRLEGVAIGLMVSLVVSSLWPSFPEKAEPAK